MILTLLLSHRTSSSLYRKVRPFLRNNQSYSTKTLLFVGLLCLLRAIRVGMARRGKWTLLLNFRLLCDLWPFNEAKIFQMVTYFWHAFLEACGQICRGKKYSFWSWRKESYSCFKYMKLFLMWNTIKNIRSWFLKLHAKNTFGLLTLSSTSMKWW